MNDIFKNSINRIKKIRWIFTVARRFSNVDRKGRAAVSTFLSTLGIAFGVMTLICVLGVMNGFQGTSINSILEVSSSHIQVSGVDSAKESEFVQFCKTIPEIISEEKYYETNGLIASSRGTQAAGIIRAVDEKLPENDKGFGQELFMLYGSFDLSDEENIVIGSTMAKTLGVTLGSQINLLALSGSTDVALISNNRKFTVTGIFETGNLEINQTFAFTGFRAAEKYFGKGAEPVFGIKLKDYSQDSYVISKISGKFPELKCDSWKNFNRSFFSTLRIEKNVIFLLVLIIFVVVGINIYNGIRKLVYERSSEISILSALGGTKSQIKSIFIVRGMSSGINGVFWGALLGILITQNIGKIFLFLADMEYYIQYFIMLIIAPENAGFLQKNLSFDVYASIPAVINPSELFIICMFGILTPLISSWFASRNVLNMNISEVLHED